MKQNNCAWRTSIGGQALIEGIMMRGPQKQAIAVRTKDGILLKTEELKLVKTRHPILGVPFIRGPVNFIDSMVRGVKALMYSAEQIPPEEAEEPSKFDEWVNKHFAADRAQKIIVALAVVLGVALSVGLFMLLPTLLAGLVTGGVKHRIVKNCIEGAIRIAIFLGYMFFATRVKDVHRVFEYHGAEHKSIHCYEKGLPLTVENVRPQPRQHPRCGTSFMFIVMIVSILVFALVSWSNMWVRMLLRILLLPVVVSISYEIIQWAGRHDNVLSAILSAPGKALQHLTTFEPDEAMMEVAIAALKAVLPEKKGLDRW